MMASSAIRAARQRKELRRANVASEPHIQQQQRQPAQQEARRRVGGHAVGRLILFEPLSEQPAVRTVVPADRVTREPDDGQQHHARGERLPQAAPPRGGLVPAAATARLPPSKKPTAVPPGFMATIPGKTVLSVSTSSAQPTRTRQLTRMTATLAALARN